MTEPMTLDRFRHLADAYGGVVARWPDSDRDAAMRMAAQPAAMAILAQASILDVRLDSWAVPAPARSLHERVVGGAPAPGKRLATRVRLRWSGVGVAAALAGAVSGTAAVAVAAPTDTSPDAGTSFGIVDTQDT